MTTGLNAEATRLVEGRFEAEKKAWDSLARYKFLMFGYYAARWVTLNKILVDCGYVGEVKNPFKGLVDLARKAKLER